MFGIRLLCAFLVGTSAVASELRMETYGDSLTAGFLAHTSVLDAPPLADIEKILSSLVAFKLSKKIAHLEKHESRALAWAALVKKALGEDVELVNVAVSGAKTPELLAQVKKAGGTKTKTIAFFFIGHNDLCHYHDATDVFAANYAKALEPALKQWDETHEESEAYIVPVADVHRTFTTLKGVVWHDSEKGKFTCETAWTSLFLYCPVYSPMIRKGTITEYLEPRVKAMNEQLEGLVSKKWNNRFTYLRDVHADEFKVEYFGTDCYHLSKAGQEKLAERILAGVKL